MNIPEHFEFHYVENNVKKSVTLLTGMLFKHHRCTPGREPACSWGKTGRLESQQRLEASAEAANHTTDCR